MAGRPFRLSNREQEILQLVWAGLSTPEIGQALGINDKTVNAHRLRIMRKFHVSTIPQLLQAALEDGLLHDPKP